MAKHFRDATKKMDFISREAAVEKMTALINESGKYTAYESGAEDACYIVEHENPADVVSRDCYDRILAENDTMREMLAQIGKKPGDKMDDVRVALRSEWIINDVGDNTLYAKCKHCLTTQVLYGGKQPTNFCPECGTDMRETGR